VEEQELEFTSKKIVGRLKRLEFNWKREKDTTSFNNLPLKKLKRIG
jgi:hypothetical protein